MIKIIQSIPQSLAITRYSRVQNYIHDIENHVTIHTQKDKKRVEDIKPLIEKLINKLKILYTIDTFLYFIIYFSFISFIFADIIFLSEITTLISTIISLMGTTIIFIILFLTNKFKNLYYQDLTLLTAHLISIYSKHENKNLEEDENKKDIFIEYFKTRGF